MSWIDFIHLNEPTFCKYIDRKNQEMAYFIEEPDYKNFSDAKDFRYIEQKYPYEKMEQDHDLKMRTKFIFAIMKDVLEQNKNLTYTDEMILKQRIDLSLIDEKQVANLCDNMIFRSRDKEFELLYHYGNLDMKTVLKHTRFSPITYLKYIEDLSLNQKGVSGTIIENLNLIYLERVLCS
ncbi:MAG: hypothetical protein IJA69_04365, partial [Clostridia bacterium]|nr:hypothetical protein [Clostridia bacterium]